MCVGVAADGRRLSYQRRGEGARRFRSTVLPSGGGVEDEEGTNTFLLR